MKLEIFLRDLGSKKGAPGGGAAAALTGATGAALVEMVSHLNDARLKNSSGNAKKAAALRMGLQGLIKKDAAAFGVIQKAYKVRKIDPAAWQTALRAGAKPPLAICESCVKAGTLAKNERSRTSAWLESDRKEALLLLRAALEAACLNVEVNLKGMKPGAFVNAARKKMKQCRHKLPRS